MLRGTTANAVLPSLKVTVPDAANGSPLAVKVADDPKIDGFADEASVTVVFCLFTVCVKVVDVLLLSLASPP